MAAGSGTVRVRADFDARDVDRGTRKAESYLDRLNRVGGRAMHGLGSAMRTTGVIGAGALVLGTKQAADAAIESEKSAGRLQTQVEALGFSYEKHAGQIDAVIQRVSQLAGLDDEELQDAFVNVARSTGDVNDALENMGLVADIARAKNMDVAKAGELVGKVAAGNTGILGRYGIVLKDGATAQEALAALQQKFAGQAKAYGESTAGSIDRGKVAWENLMELLGKGLLPLLTRLATALVAVVTAIQRHWPQIKATAQDVFGAVEKVVARVKGAITGFVSRNRDDIRSFLEAIRNVATVVRDVFEGAVIPVIRRLLPAIKQIFEGALSVIRGVVRVISGILTGDLGKAWDGVKDIFRGGVQVALGILRAATAPFREIASKIGEAISDVIGGAWRGLKTVVASVIQFMKDRLADVLGFFAKILEAASHIPLIGGKFKKAAEGIRQMQDELRGTNEQASRTPGLLQQIIDKAQQLQHTPIRAPQVGGNRGPTRDPSAGISAARDRDRPTKLDYREKDIAEAALTKDTKDDITAADALVKFWKHKLRLARKTHDPRKIREAAQALKAARDERRDLVPDPPSTDSGSGPSAAETTADTTQQSQLAALQTLVDQGKQRLELEQQRSGELARALAVSQAQYPALMAAITEHVNGLLGQRVGQLLAAPGGGPVARYA